MNARIVNLVLLGITLGLAGIIMYLIYLLKYNVGAIQYITNTKTEVVTNKVTQIAVRKINATNFLAGLINRPLNWSALESTNYLTYINNLRNFGCPEETIRDIILTDVAKLYAKQRTQLRAQLPKPSFWQSPETFASRSPDFQRILEQIEALDEQQRALVKELLGVDYDAELAKYSGESEPAGLALDFLAPEKQQAVDALLRKYDELESAFFTSLRGTILPQDEAALQRLQQQREAELAQVLSPEELEEYQLRHSPLADELRARLDGFEPSEAEFRQLFKIQKTYELTLNHPFHPDPEQNEEIRARILQEATPALNAELQRVLGDTRYAEYKRAQDEDYRALLQLGERLALPPDKAARVYEMKVAAETQKQQIETNPNLTADQRLAALIAITRETERTVSGVLGSEAYRAYQQVGAHWLRELSTPAELHPELNNLLGR